MVGPDFLEYEATPDVSNLSDCYGQILLKNSKFFWMGNLSLMSRVLQFGIRGDQELTISSDKATGELT